MSETLPESTPAPSAPGTAPPRPRARPWLEVPAPAETEADNAWLITYLDMLTLLLTLFVVLLAYSSFQPERFADVTEALAQTAADAPSASQRLADSIAAQLSAAGISEGLEVVAEKRRITLQFQDKILFASGRSELNAEGRQALLRLAPFIKPEQVVSVEGHTDNVPIYTGLFASNWELSSARAASVVRQLIDYGAPPRSLRAIGYGEMHPIADNATAEGRGSNRRVTVVIDLPAEPGN